jgi:hypothetical protein
LTIFDQHIKKPKGIETITDDIKPNKALFRLTVRCCINKPLFIISISPSITSLKAGSVLGLIIPNLGKISQIKIIKSTAMDFLKRKAKLIFLLEWSTVVTLLCFFDESTVVRLLFSFEGATGVIVKPQIPK